MSQVSEKNVQKMYRGPGSDIGEVFDLFAKTFLSNQRGFHVITVTSLSLNLDTLKSIAVSDVFYHHSTWGIRVFKRGPNCVGESCLHHGIRSQAVE